MPNTFKKQTDPYIVVQIFKNLGSNKLRILNKMSVKKRNQTNDLKQLLKGNNLKYPHKININIICRIICTKNCFKRNK